MKLVFTDIESNKIIVNIEATHVIDEHFAYWVVDFDSPIYKTYDFMIDCALYGLNEGQVFADSYDDDEGNPLANWALIDSSDDKETMQAYVQVTQESDGFLATFFNEDDLITHDAFYEDLGEMMSSLIDYIKADKFDVI
jgi:hypothetical protein